MAEYTFLANAGATRREIAETSERLAWNREIRRSLRTLTSDLGAVLGLGALMVFMLITVNVN